eukprot:COSAG01_NODE_17144_length_1174_cov_1.755349_1_plen_83_part_00
MTREYVNLAGERDVSFEQMRADFAEKIQPITAAADGVSFAELLADAGGLVAVLGIQESPNSYYLKNKAQQVTQSSVGARTRL